MRKLGVVLFAGVLITGSMSLADAGGGGVSAKIGTPGVGVDVTIGVNERLSVRGTLNWFSYEYDDIEFDDVDDASDGAIPDEAEQVVDKITAELDLLSFGVLVDWHPWANGFRLTGGIMVNLNEASLSVEPGDTIEIDGTEYTLLSLDGEISFIDHTPVQQGENILTEIAHMLSYINVGALIITLVSIAILLLWETKFFKSRQVFSVLPGGLAAVVAGTVLQLFFRDIPSLALKDGMLVNLPVPSEVGGILGLLTFPDFSRLGDPHQ